MEDTFNEQPDEVDAQMLSAGLEESKEESKGTSPRGQDFEESKV